MASKKINQDASAQLAKRSIKPHSAPRLLVENPDHVLLQLTHSTFAVFVKSSSFSMREKRLSTLVRFCFLDGKRNRGSVVKLENRASLASDGAAAEAEPLVVFCLTIASYRTGKLFCIVHFKTFLLDSAEGRKNLVMY